MKIKEGFILREVAGRYIVVAVGDRVKHFNGIINLNETGALLWKTAENGATEEQLVQALLTEYDVDEATARADVNKFVEKLREAELVY